MITTIYLTVEEYGEHCDEDNGLCLNCGEIRCGSTEPDAENYPCEACGEDKVMGFEMAMISGYIEISNED